jgi:hypothetical protein
VSLKTAYLKLHHLLDAGCVFVGHGLRQDFRMLNLTVPPEQVRVPLMGGGAIRCCLLLRCDARAPLGGTPPPLMSSPAPSRNAAHNTGA